EVDDVDGDLGSVPGLQLGPYLLLEVAALTARRFRLRRRLLAERVGVSARDAEEAAVRGDLDRVRAAEGLRDHDLPALLERHGVTARDLHRFGVALELHS